MALATITSITPTYGNPAGVAFTIAGTGFSHCTVIYFRKADGGLYTAQSVVFDSDTAAHGTSPNMPSIVGQYVDVGVYDSTAAQTVYLLHAWFVSSTPAPYAGPAGQWDQTLWDGSGWQPAQFAPGAGWRYDWQVFYQSGTTVVWDMTASTVEVRWSTDSHKTGDGTYRGDLQPGTLALQIHDANHRAETLDKTGTIWLHYGPSNYTWGFYVDTVTRQLVSPTDPTAADVVITGSPWPIRLTSDCTYNFARGAERVDARLAAIAAYLSRNTNQRLPTYNQNIAADSHTVAAIPTPTTVPANAYPAALSLIRDAATNGVAWVSAGLNASGAGEFTLNYARWDTGTTRLLAPTDVVAGIPFDQTMDDLITQVTWNAVNPAGVANTTSLSDAAWANYGMARLTLRLYGDVSSSSAPEWSSATNTAIALMNARRDPTRSSLSAVTATSGARTHPAGGAGPAWNPAAHVWSPVDVLQWNPPVAYPGQNWQPFYWVTKTDHRLRAAAWDSAHTVEVWAQAVALPP
jgi:hypothetical protein